MTDIIKNLRVYDIAESILASGYPMMAAVPSGDELDDILDQIEDDIDNGVTSNPHIKRAISLANAKGGGHDQFLSGILVSFDLTLSVKAWVEMERYKFVTFVSSQSTMHRISAMTENPQTVYFVDSREIEIMKEKLRAWEDEPTPENYQALLYNVPVGLQLTARVTTNYRALSNIYQQRKSHRLFEWQEFCRELDALPLAEELIKKFE